MDRSVQENYYLRLPSGLPTQADIWEGLPAWADTEESCTGILITPRCDFAHDKTPVINYLPIVSLKKYLLQFGGFGLVEQEIGRIHARSEPRRAFVDKGRSIQRTVYGDYSREI